MSEPNEPCSNCENLYKENQELEQRLKTHVQLSHDKTHRIKELEEEKNKEMQDALREQRIRLGAETDEVTAKLEKVQDTAATMIKELEAERDELKAALQNLLAVANAHDCWGEAVEQAQAALKEKE